MPLDPLGSWRRPAVFHEVLCFYPFPKQPVVPFQTILKVLSWVLRILHKETTTAEYPCISHAFLGFLIPLLGLQPQCRVSIRFTHLFITKAFQREARFHPSCERSRSWASVPQSAQSAQCPARGACCDHSDAASFSQTLEIRPYRRQVQILLGIGRDVQR